MSASDEFERELADVRLGSGTPATWYVGLSRTPPNDDGSGFTEPTGGSYARVAVTNNTANWPAATTTGGRTVKRNGNKITWTNPTASWGQIVAFGLFTASSGGTSRLKQLLDDPITISAGNTPVEFDVGEIEIEVE